MLQTQQLECNIHHNIPHCSRFWWGLLGNVSFAISEHSTQGKSSQQEKTRMWMCLWAIQGTVLDKHKGKPNTCLPIIHYQSLLVSTTFAFQLISQSVKHWKRTNTPKLLHFVNVTWSCFKTRPAKGKPAIWVWAHKLKILF